MTILQALAVISPASLSLCVNLWLPEPNNHNLILSACRADGVLQSVALRLRKGKTVCVRNSATTHLEGSSVNPGAPVSAADMVKRFKEKSSFAQVANFSDLPKGVTSVDWTNQP